jgi:hypothetical protein
MSSPQHGTSSRSRGGDQLHGTATNKDKAAKGRACSYDLFKKPLSFAVLAAIGALLALASPLRFPDWPPSLPSTYAICSTRASTIYTAQASQPTVGCFVVDSSQGLIVDRGALDEIRDRWGDYRSYGFLFKRGLKIKHISKGAVIPGLAVGSLDRLMRFNSGHPRLIGERTSGCALSSARIWKEPRRGRFDVCIFSPRSPQTKSSFVEDRNVKV